MADTAYTAFFDHVLPAVPGCPQPMAIDAIRRAAIEFCEKTLAWIYKHPAINVVAAQMAYPFVPPTGAVVAKVLQAWHNDIKITPKTPDELNEIYANWLTIAGTPQYITQDDERNLLLVPTPSAALTAGLVLRVALKPTLASDDIETSIYEEYRDAIASGAKARLMLIKDKPYSDMELGALEMGLFNAAVADAKFKAQKGCGRARVRTVTHFF